MLEAVKNSRLSMRVLFVLAAMVVAIMAASAMSNAPGSPVGSLGAEEADAAVAYRQIKGTVFRSDTQRVAPYAYVDLWKYTPNCVQSTCWNVVKSVRADPYGRYNFGYQQTAFHYHVRAFTSVGGKWYQGEHGPFWLRSDISTPANINVTIQMPVPW